MKSRLQLDDILLPANGFFYSAFTYPFMPSIISENNKNKMVLKQWGLIPGWAKDETQATEMRKLGFNSKAETVAQKPLFKRAFETGRCLLPAAGFFEWREVNKKKYPYYIYPKNNTYFLFAGISEKWTNRNSGEIIDTFSIVTCPANSLLTFIHNTKKRMPLILNEHEINIWLNGNAADALELAKPYADNEMEAHTISSLVSNPRGDRNNADVQNKYTYPELEQNLLF